MCLSRGTGMTFAMLLLLLYFDVFVPENTFTECNGATLPKAVYELIGNCKLEITGLYWVAIHINVAYLCVVVLVSYRTTHMWGDYFVLFPKQKRPDLLQLMLNAHNESSTSEEEVMDPDAKLNYSVAVKRSKCMCRVCVCVCVCGVCVVVCVCVWVHTHVF